MSRKYLLIVLILIATESYVFCQTYHNMSGGVTESATIPCVYSMVEYDNYLFVAGLFKKAGNVVSNNIAKWDGTNWTQVSGGTRSGYGNGPIECMAVYNGELYIGGFFDSVGTINSKRIAKWNGGEWISIGSGLTGRSNETTGLYTMIVFNNKLYIGGMFDSVNGIKADNIACFDGSSWSSVGNGLRMDVWTLGIHNDKLYAGGNIYNIMKLENNEWVATGNNFGDYSTTLLSYKNELYGGGARIYNEQNGFMKYNGINWELVGGPANDEVLDIYEYKNELIVSGRFTKIGGINANRLAKWNGIEWSSIGNGVVGNAFYNGVNVLAEFKGNLFIGGNFNYAGNLTVNNIAYITFPITSINTNESQDKNISSLQNYPNPFNPKTTITFSTPIPSFVTLSIYNSLGQKVEDLINGSVSAGNHDVIWSAIDFPSGIYFCHIKYGSQVITKKITLIK